MIGLGAVVALMLVAVLAAPVLLFAGGGLMYSTSSTCSAGTAAAQPPATTAASNSIPANYLALFKSIGARYRVPWVVLAGIGKVESNDGRTTLPGVHSGSNAFGAAGPMQIGIGGAAGNTWGGAPVHPASQQVSGVATDANGDGTASVYDPADAIAGAAKYLLEHGILTNVAGAIFAYNHLTSYVQQVLGWANRYATGGFQVSSPVGGNAPACVPGIGLASSSYAAGAIAYARQQIGKPYLWGGTGPDAFDCSGLTMMAWRSAGISIERTSQEQWASERHVTEPVAGDLVFFPGSDGTWTSPGHVGIVTDPARHEMIDAYAPGVPVGTTGYGPAATLAGLGQVVGFTQPWGS